MSNIRNKLKNNERSVFYTLLIFLFIYISDDTVIFGTNGNESLISLKYIYICVMSVMLYVYSLLKSSIIKKRRFAVFGILSCSIIITMLMNNEIRLGYFYKIALFIYSIALIRLISFKQFQEIFVKIIYVLAFISIIGFLAKLVYPSLLSIAPTLTTNVGSEFNNFYLFLMPKGFYSGFIRNYGIFREPGVYQMYLIMALLFHINMDEVNLKYLLVLSVAIVTTMSTTGYIALLLVMVLLILKRDGLSRKKKAVFFTLIGVGLVYLIANTTIFSISADNQYNSVVAKLFNSSRLTTVARFASVTENFKIFAENPIWGVGIGAIDRLFPAYTLATYGVVQTNNTNTILIQYASHGFIYGTIWLIGYYKFSKRIASSFAQTIIVFATIMVLYMGENLTYSAFFSLFLLYGLFAANSDVNKEKYL